MLLAFSEYGSSQKPLVLLLHGLLGSRDNWHSIATQLGVRYHCLVPDLRNHGTSPHLDEMSYPSMAQDIVELLAHVHSTSASLVGHSMGGKVAMAVALTHPHLIDKLVVVDIAPRAYEPHHDDIIRALHSLPLERFTHRKEIEDALAPAIPNLTTRRMLLKNLKRQNNGTFAWKVNLPAIERNYSHIVAGIESTAAFEKPVLFIRGENSEYIQMTDLETIATLFPRAELITVNGAGHNVHADAPERFIEIITDFLIS